MLCVYSMEIQIYSASHRLIPEDMCLGLPSQLYQPVSSLSHALASLYLQQACNSLEQIPQQQPSPTLLSTTSHQHPSHDPRKHPFLNTLLPTLSFLSTYLPTLSFLSTLLPTLSFLSTLLPTLSFLSTHLPTLSVLSTPLPTPSPS